MRQVHDRLVGSWGRWRGALGVLVFACLSLGGPVSAAGEEGGGPAPLDVRAFGAVGDGEHDDTAALQAAIDAAVEQRSAVYLPRGVYAVSEPIRVNLATYRWGRALRITGDWARLQAVEPMETVLEVDTASHLTIERLLLDANDLAEHGFVGFKISTRRALIERVRVTGARSHGFVLEKCQGAVFRGCDADRNGGDGWHIIDANAAVFQDCVGFGNAGNGMTITRADFSGGCIVNNVWVERNAGHGIHVTGTQSPVTIRSGWVEGNGRDGVRLAARAGVVRELHITGRGDGNSWAVHLADGADGCIVENNTLTAGSGDAGYARVRIEETIENHHVQRNQLLTIHGAREVDAVFGPPALDPDTALEPVGANLVENASFDIEGHWTRTRGDLDTHGRTGRRARSHDHAYHLTGRGSAGVWQPVQLEPGARYRLSGWMFVEQGRGDLTVHNGDNLVYGFCRSDTAEWTYQEMDFTAAGTSGYVMLQSAVSSDERATVYFDDIELRQLRPVSGESAGQVRDE